MKSFTFLLFLSFFIPVSLFAQFSVIDWETVGQDWTFTIFSAGTDGNYSVVANPSIGGINTSANCGLLIVGADGDPWAGIWSDDIPEFTLNASNSMITVMVYKDVISDFNLKLEAPGGGGWAHDNNVPNTLTNQWEMLTFDYSADIGQTVGRLTIIPDFSPSPRTYGSMNYFDNIDFGGNVPVELTSFTANYSGNTVQLKWTTATELNNLGFDVERSFNGYDFGGIGFVLGKGTTTETQNYSYVDRTISPNTNYWYRLKQIDFNGNYEYSEAINLGESLPLTFELAQNYPNPFNPTTTISFGLPVKSEVSLNIYNIVGEKVLTLFNGSLEAGHHDYNVDAGSLTSGIYIYVLNAVDNDGTPSTISKKMTLLK